MNTPTETTAPRPSHWLRAIEFRKHQLGREYRDTLNDKAREGISDEDYATTMATLEKMALNLGWSEDDDFGPRGRGFGPGFGRGPKRGFGRGFGPGFGPGHGHGHGHHDHPHHRPENAQDSSPAAEPAA